METISDPDLPADVRESMERHGEQTCLTVPLRFGDKRLGMLTLVETAAEREFSEADLEFARGFGEQAAMAMHNAHLFENVKGLHLGNLRALSSALTAKDVYTIGHTAPRRGLRRAARGRARLDRRGRIQQLEEATYLHDIGKIAVADRVLLKSGPLTDEEWALMRQHPVISAEIIEPLLDERLRRRRALTTTSATTAPAIPTAWPGRDPAHRPAPLPGGLLRRHVVAPRLPAGAHPRRVREELRELQRHAVRSRSWWTRSSACSPRLAARR